MPVNPTVSSSNFTTLYSGGNNPGTSGNLLVNGNLTVTGTSNLQGNVAVGGTLTVDGYTFPAADGTANQVLTTDGAGNLYWEDVSALDTNYTIQADTATGGANLTLVGSDATTDSVKFASGTNLTVSRTDASTITVGTNSAVTFDDVTVNNNFLVNDGGFTYYNNADIPADFYVLTTNTDAEPVRVIRLYPSPATPQINDTVGWEFLSENSDQNAQRALRLDAKITDFTTATFSAEFNVKLTNNGGTPVTKFTVSGNGDATVVGDLIVNGNDIKSSTSATAITLSDDDVSIGGDLSIPAGRVLIDNRVSINTDTLTTTTTTADQVLAQYSTATFRSGDITVSMTSGTDYQIVKITWIHDGTTVFFNTYSDLKTNVDLATFNADISGGLVRILTTPVNASTTYNLLSHAIYA